MIPFPISGATPIAHPGPLPDSADVAIIGAGVMGICTALFLARKGQRVVVVEKGRVAGEQSARNWGWIRQQGRDGAELPIMVEANRLWRQLAQEVDTDIGLAEGGVTYIARTRDELDSFAAWLPVAASCDVDTRLLDAAETAALVPDAARGFAGALHTASDLRAEPWRAVPAIARRAAADGVTIVENCAARALDLEAGRITGLLTEQGRVAVPQVVVAGGAWSSLFLRAHGVTIPQLAVRASVMAVQAPAMAYPGAAEAGGTAWRPRADGGYTLAPGFVHQLFLGPDAFRHLRAFVPQLRRNPLGTRLRPAAPRGYPDAWTTPRRWAPDGPGPFEAIRVLNPDPDLRSLGRLLRSFEALFPDLGPPRVTARWAGLIDTMPDVVPVVDRVARIPGLIVATGLSGHGFGIGPGMGRVVADLVAGNDPGHDLTRFRLARFSDGTAIDLGDGL
ncbi:MAG: Glycine/D-amino acid oxidases (deaminating) [Rhodobacteraceae bacterium HLUCCA08]|nr:MAG: Glycine/D-amino acid oxidases (deaminating) [Rhodobacteraceae bacterium HLUCCA08]